MTNFVTFPDQSLQQFLPHDAMQAWTMPSCGACPSVRHVCTFCQNKTNRIFKISSLSGSQTILVFRHETSWQYSNDDSLAEE